MALTNVLRSCRLKQTHLRGTIFLFRILIDYNVIFKHDKMLLPVLDAVLSARTKNYKSTYNLSCRPLSKMILFLS